MRRNHSGGVEGLVYIWAWGVGMQRSDTEGRLKVRDWQGLLTYRVRVGAWESDIR